MEKFDIGDWVKYKGQVVRRTDGKFRCWSFVPCSGIGRVIGKTKRFSGEIKSWGCYDNIPQNYLDIKESHIFYLVSQGWFNKPVFVREEDLEFIPFSEIPDKFPQLKTLELTESERKKASEIMKEEMKNWPRDEKGRWI